MIRSERHGGAARISDFSAALLHAQQDATSRGSYDDDLQALLDAESDAGQTSTRHSNLSNVLNRIRDRGPADNNGADNNGQAPQHTRDDARMRQPENAQARANPAPTSRPPSPVAAPVRDWRQQIPLIFMLLSMLALAYMQYRTENRITALDEALLQREQGADLSISTAMHSQQQLDKLQRSIHSLSTQMQQLRTGVGQNAVNTQAGQASGNQAVAERLEQLQHNTEAALQRNREAIESLQQRLLAMPSKPALPPAGKKHMETAGTSPAAGKDRETPARTRVGASAWKVNLAALSSRQQARMAMQRLQGTGVNPLIEEIEVKGRKVYRLSVDGFPTKAAARRFVDKARRYGFDKGWIRKG